MKIWSFGVVLTIQSLSIVGVVLMTASPGLTANVFRIFGNELCDRLVNNPRDRFVGGIV